VSDTEFLDTLPAEERERLANLVADNFATQVPPTASTMQTPIPATSSSRLRNPANTAWSG